MKFWGVVAAVLTLGLGAAWANAMPDAEAAAYLKTLAEKGKNYQRRADKTYFFSRAQLKYGLERNDFLRRWCDRPLMQETGFAKSGTFQVSHSGSYSEKGFINRNTFVVESKLLEKYNFAGFAFFPELKSDRSHVVL